MLVSGPVADVLSTMPAMNQVLYAFLTDSPASNKTELCCKASSNVITAIKTVLANFIIRAWVLCRYEENCGGGDDDDNGGGGFDSEYREDTQSYQMQCQEFDLICI